ncbi:MAG: response regulator [Terriglobales bacterium]
MPACSEIATIFTAFPPPPPPDDSQAWPASQGGTPSSSKLRVLVVDDDTLIADTLVDILQDAGFEVMAAYDGETAIARARSFNPDVLVSDVVMHGLNGVDASLEIQRLLPRCRIILLSGQAATADLLAQSPAAQSFEIFAKPVHPETLLAALLRRS